MAYSTLFTASVHCGVEVWTKIRIPYDLLRIGWQILRKISRTELWGAVDDGFEELDAPALR